MLLCRGVFRFYSRVIQSQISALAPSLLAKLENELVQNNAATGGDVRAENFERQYLWALQKINWKRITGC